MRPERHTSVPGPSAARRTAPRLLVAPLVAALALAGCGSPEPPPSQGEPTAAAGVATARPTVDPTAAADAGIKTVAEKMKGDRTKHRVTFYYLLAEATGTLGKLG